MLSQTSCTMDFGAVESDQIEIVGDKGANLGLLPSAGFDFRPGFTVSNTAYRNFLRLTGLGELAEKYVREFDYADVMGLEDFTPRLAERMRHEPGRWSDGGSVERGVRRARWHPVHAGRAACLR